MISDTMRNALYTAVHTAFREEGYHVGGKFMALATEQAIVKEVEKVIVHFRENPDGV